MESKLVFETLESDPDGIIDASGQILNVQGIGFRVVADLLIAHQGHGCILLLTLPFHDISFIFSFV